MNWLVFFPKCGQPTKLTDYVMEHYIANGFSPYCWSCKQPIPVTPELQDKAKKGE